MIYYYFSHSWLEIISTPISCQINRNWLVERPFVIPLVTLSAVETFSRLNLPLVTQSRTKWYRTSIFKALWCKRFFANATSPLLSLNMTRVKFKLACRNVQASRPCHNASLAASDATTYSASVVEVAINSWSFDLHKMALCLNRKSYLATGKVWVSIAV